MRHVFAGTIALAVTASIVSAGQPSLGRAPRSATGGAAGPATAAILGALAYGTDLLASPERLVSFDVAVPGNITPVATPGRFLSGMDALPSDPDTFYAVDFNTNELVRIDRVSASVTVIGTATPPAGQVWTGLAGAPNGLLYGVTSDCSSSTLLIVDPADGAVNPVGTVTNGPCLIAIAAGSGGTLYALDIANDTLVAVDPSTAAGTVVGSLGYDANYAQGLDADPGSGTLYIAAYNGTLGRAELRTADPTSGATVLVGVFPPGTQIDGLSVSPYAAPTPTPTPTRPPGATPTPGGPRLVPAAGPRGTAVLVLLVAVVGWLLLLERRG